MNDLKQLVQGRKFEFISEKHSQEKKGLFLTKEKETVNHP